MRRRSSTSSGLVPMSEVRRAGRSWRRIAHEFFDLVHYRRVGPEEGNLALGSGDSC